jgi:hypothetical protein
MLEFGEIRLSPSTAPPGLTWINHIPMNDKLHAGQTHPRLSRSLLTQVKAAARLTGLFCRRQSSNPCGVRAAMLIVMAAIAVEATGTVLAPSMTHRVVVAACVLCCGTGSYRCLFFACRLIDQMCTFFYRVLDPDQVAPPR